MIINMLSSSVYSIFFDVIRISRNFGMIFAERERDRLTRAKDNRYFPKFIYNHNIFYYVVAFLCVNY